MRSGEFRHLRRRLLVVLVVALIGWDLSAQTAHAAAVPDGTVELVIGRDASLSHSQLLDELAGLVTAAEDLTGLGASVVEIPASALDALQRRIATRVRYIEENHRYTAAFWPSDPWYGSQAELTQARISAAWPSGIGDGTVVAVVDSGVRPNEDLVDVTGSSLVGGYDFVDGDDDPTDVLGGTGHGTLVATTLAARSNGFGIVGACPGCRVMPVRVLDASGEGSSDKIAAGIRFAVDRGARVINLSLSGPSSSTLISDAVSYARSRDVVVVAAAGNSGNAFPLTDSTPLEYPAALPGVLSVGATCSPTAALLPPNPPAPEPCPGGPGTVARFSSRGSSWVRIGAPGVLYATDGPTTYYFTGSSAAAPLVAGAAALVRAAHPGWSETQVRAALTSTAAPVSPGGLIASGELRADVAVGEPDANLPDITPPIASVDPLPAWVGGTAAVRVRASDDRGLGQIRLEVGGTDARPTFEFLGADNWRADWDTTRMPDGPVSVTAVVTDAAGNATRTAARATVIDNRPPEVALAGPGFATVQRGPFGVFVAAGDAGTGVKATLVVAGNDLVAGFSGAGGGYVVVPVKSPGPLLVRALSVDHAGRLSLSNPIIVVADPPRPKVLAKRRVRSRR